MDGQPAALHREHLQVRPLPRRLAVRRILHAELVGLEASGLPPERHVDDLVRDEDDRDLLPPGVRRQRPDQVGIGGVRGADDRRPQLGEQHLDRLQGHQAVAIVGDQDVGEREARDADGVQVAASRRRRASGASGSATPWVPRPRPAPRTARSRPRTTARARRGRPGSRGRHEHRGCRSRSPVRRPELPGAPTATTRRRSPGSASAGRGREWRCRRA